MYYRPMRRHTTAKWTVIFVFTLLSMMFSVLIPVLLAVQPLTGG